MSPRQTIRGSRRRHQQGAALLTALVIVTLVVTIAASMVWQQWRAVQVETAERARTQSAWILSGALDWARLILREDARSNRPTALTEPWALPLAEARLSTFLAADTSNAEDAPDAFLSGRIIDVQSRYNLNNLVQDAEVVPAELAILQRLFDNIGVSSDLAQRIADGLRAAVVPASPDDTTVAPLLPRKLSQLAWLGIDEGAIAQMQPYVTLLPTRTTVNLNTAPREVLAAVIEGLDLASAEQIIQRRQRNAFRTPREVEAMIQPKKLDDRNVGVLSTYFEVTGRLRLDDWSLEERSLVQRNGLDVIPLQRERLTQREGAGS
jgi:general secretion pathway protein K